MWYILDDKSELKKISVKNIEDKKIKDVLKMDRTPPVLITATMETLLTRAMDQNYIPVVDDRGTFMGIVTRRDIIRYFYRENFYNTEDVHSFGDMLVRT